MFAMFDWPRSGPEPFLTGSGQRWERAYRRQDRDRRSKKCYMYIECVCENGSVNAACRQGPALRKEVYCCALFSVAATRGTAGRGT